MKTNKILAIALVLSFCFILFFYQIALTAANLMEKSKIETKRLNQTVDSLKQEILIRDFDLGRYEYMLDELEDVNPDAAEKIYEILSQTE